MIAEQSYTFNSQKNVTNVPLSDQDAFPMMSAQLLLHRLYPHDLMLGKEGRTGVEDVLKVSKNHYRNEALVIMTNLLNNWSPVAHYIKHSI